MNDPQPADAYDELDDLYDEWVVSVTEDIPFYLDLARELAEGRDPGSPLRVLELGAGSGRITLPLAAAGHTVHAVDTSQSQLCRLAIAAFGEAVEDQLVTQHADMLDLDPARLPRFDLVIAPFRSLLHVARERDAMFARVRELLAPGGTFSFDVFHPTREGARESHDRWMLRRRIELAEGRWSIWERGRFDIDAGTLELTVRCDFAAASLAPGRRAGDDAPDVPRQREATMLLHTPPAHDWRESLERAGFAIGSVHSWFDGEPFTPGDEDSIWIVDLPR